MQSVHQQAASEPVSGVAAAPAIHPSEEADLSWYFGPGAAYFERSTFGDQLRRAAEFSQGSQPCETCEGFGFVQLTAEEIIARNRRITELEHAIRERLRTIEDQEKRDREIAKLAREREKLNEETVCAACSGTKVSARRLNRKPKALTARPRPAQREELRTEPEDWALCRYARVSRRLDQLPDEIVNVLRLYYGDIGTRWASEREGRLLALYALTAPGKKLARRGVSKRDADALEGLGVRPDESVVSQANAQRANPDTTRGRLLLEARGQAKRLLADAARVWTVAQ